MKRFARLLALAAPLVLAPVASSPLTGCGGGGGGGPIGPGANLCSRIRVADGGAVSIDSAPGCTAITGGTSNVVRDQFGRVTSLDFDIQCIAGANDRVTGRVSSVTYNNLGEVLSWSATINGRSCAFP